MKNILFILVSLLLGFNTFSQKKENTIPLFELQKKKVNIDIDKSIFTSVHQNMYVSKNPDALILALFIPISYDKQKVKMNNKTIAEGMEFKGEITINNEKVLLLSGNIIKKGIDFTKQKYYIKYDKNTSIELTTMLAVNKADKKMLLEIVNSVVEKN